MITLQLTEKEASFIQASLGEIRVAYSDIDFDEDFDGDPSEEEISIAGESLKIAEIMDIEYKIELVLRP